MSFLTTTRRVLLAPHGSAFSPADLLGLALWLRADQGAYQDAARTTAATTGDPLGGWADQSGNGKHASQSTASAKPALQSVTANGKNYTVARFTTDDALSIASLALSTYSLFLVFKASVNGLLYEQSANANSNPGAYFYTSTGSSIYTQRAGGQSDKNRAANWGSDGTWRIVRHAFGGTHATHKLWINGTDQSMTTDAHSADPGTSTATDTLYLASRAGTSLFLTGDVAELLIYSPALTDAQAARVEREWLSPRYGLAVA